MASSPLAEEHSAEEHSAKERTSTGGLWLMVGAAFFWSVATLFVKLVGQRLASQQIIFVSSAVMLLASGIHVRWADRASLFATSKKGPSGQRFLWMRSVLGFVSMSCFYFALTKLPLADATVFHYTNPVWTALIAALLLSEPLKASEGAGVLLSLIGVAFIAQPTFLFGGGPLFDGAPLVGGAPGSLNLAYVGISLLGAVMAGSAYVAIRRLRAQRHPLVIIFYFSGVSTLASFPLAVLSGLKWPTLWEWIFMVGGIGLLSQAAQICLTKGLHRVKAGRAMAVSYLQIVFATLWGVLLFSEVPDLLSVAGAIFVIGGTVLAARS